MHEHVKGNDLKSKKKRVKSNLKCSVVEVTTAMLVLRLDVKADNAGCDICSHHFVKKKKKKKMGEEEKETDKKGQ